MLTTKPARTTYRHITHNICATVTKQNRRIVCKAMYRCDAQGNVDRLHGRDGIGVWVPFAHHAHHADESLVHFIRRYSRRRTASTGDTPC